MMTSPADLDIDEKISAASIGLQLIDEDELSNLKKNIKRGLCEGMDSYQIVNYMAEVAASMTHICFQFSVMAARFLLNNLYSQNNGKTFSQYVIDNRNIFEESFVKFISENSDYLNLMVDHSLDFKNEMDMLAFKTLERSYLLKDSNGKTIELPQFMNLRVAVWVTNKKPTKEKDLLKRIRTTYEALSNHLYIHASPTLFNSAIAGKCQLSSCFLMNINLSSIENIFKSISECALISDMSGGIGISLDYNQCNTSQPRDLIKLLKILDGVSCFADQGGKRPGAIAVYLEPWHEDILNFLDMKKNTGMEELRARNLFYGLWIPDLFMKRVESDLDWTLLDPIRCNDLTNLFGDEFERKYLEFEDDYKVIKGSMKARTLLEAIVKNLIECGVPYICFKDHVNRKNNQSNLGTIKCSNLCTEIMQYCDANETAVCNLASIVLDRFVDKSSKVFDFDRLSQVVELIVENLNQVIDINKFPTRNAEKSSKTHRAIGIGVQGLADLFAVMELPFCSEEAKVLNAQIFETIYYSAVKHSCRMVKEFGFCQYESFKGSPTSRGILQMDLWDEVHGACNRRAYKSRYDSYKWDELREDVKKYGLCNSLLVSLMPTVTTCQIVGSNESIEPFNYNSYIKRVLSGSFQVVNKHLVRQLISRGLWTREVRDEIKRAEGSIQSINCIPDSIKKLYLTAYEIDQVELQRMTADRSRYIDQSQSNNIFISNSINNLVEYIVSLIISSWKEGLKTGVYYLRSRPSTQRKMICSKRELTNTDDLSVAKKTKKENNCDNDSAVGCLSCSM